MKNFYFYLGIIALLFFPYTLTAQYCIPTFSSGCTLGDNIDGVIIQDSASNYLLNHLNTGCSIGGYGDFTNDTSLHILVDANQTYTMTITTTYSGFQHQRVYIDFGVDGSFEDPGDLVLSSTGPSSSSNPTIGTITIPNMAGVFTTRLRVFNHYNSLPPNSCTPTSSWGEVHDYTITIVGENPNCVSPTNLVLDSSTSTNASFSWTASPDETNGYNWAVMASGDDPDVDTPIEDGSTATGIVTATTTQLVQNTNYSIYVQANCGSDLSFWTGPLDILTPITPPLNDECTDAFILPIGIDFDDSPLVGNTLGATNDSNDPLPICDAFNFATNGKDVWYTVTVPASGNVNVETRTNNDPGMNNTGMEIYSGICGNLALIECNADDGEGFFSLIELTGQTPGEILLVRVWGYNNHAGEFLISAYAPPLPCDRPSDVALVNVEVDTAEFSWTASPTETSGYEWVVMADGENPDFDTPIDSGTVGAGVTTATASGLSSENNYDFYVRADCDSDGMSYWEGPLSFTTAVASVNDHSIGGLTLYPNPMGDVVNVTAQVEIEKVVIFSLTGQKLVEMQVGSLNSQIDVSNFASGPYLMYVTTSTGKVGVFNLIKK